MTSGSALLPQPIKIWWRDTSGHVEELDEAHTLNEARHLVREYQIAFPDEDVWYGYEDIPWVRLIVETKEMEHERLEKEARRRADWN